MYSKNKTCLKFANKNCLVAEIIHFSWCFSGKFILVFILVDGVNIQNLSWKMCDLKLKM